MSSIDSRIVEMKFNNAQFESGVKQSTESLGKFEQGLKLHGATKGLEEVQAKANRFSLRNIANGVQSIADKFTALGVIGVTALANIANKAVNAGLQVAKALTIDPVKAGLDEYELKMGSIQTILANTSKNGTTLDGVSNALDDLNNYADKTIYNFAEMTKNIGLFTNAGIGLEDATSMIKGFSNEAAASGTSSAGAAGAAYQLSQALSAGVIRLMDWRSLTNVGMGNKNMQTSLIQIADAMGMFEGKTVDATGAAENFNGSLEQQWLTADVMQTYLKIQAGELSQAQIEAIGLTGEQAEAFLKQQQIAEDAATKVRTLTQLYGTMQEAVGSGWATTFSIIVGDFDEATELFTGVNNVLGGMLEQQGKERNAMFQAWKDLGGRDSAINAIKNLFEGFMGFIKPIQEAFREIFPPMTAQRLNYLTEQVEKFTERLKIGEDYSENLRRTFKGLFAIFGIGVEVVKKLLGPLGTMLSRVGEGSGGVLEFTAKIGDMLVKLYDIVKTGGSVTDFFTNLYADFKNGVPIIDLVKERVTSFIDTIKGLLPGGDVDGAADNIESNFNPISNIFEKITGIIDKIKEALAPVKDFLQPLIDMVKEFGSSVVDSIKNADFNTLLDILNGVLLGGLVLTIRKFITNLGNTTQGVSIKDLFTGGVNSIVGAINGVFGTMTETLKTMQGTLKAATLIQIAIAIALLAGSAVMLSLVDSAALAKALGAMSVMFIELFGAMSVFEKLSSGTDVVKLMGLTAALTLLAIAIMLLSVSVKSLASLEWDELLVGLGGLAGILAIIAGFTRAMQNVQVKMAGTAVSLILLGIAIRVLVSSVKELSDIPWQGMVSGLLGVGSLLGALGLFTKFAKVNKQSLGAMVGLIAIGIALKLMASAMSEFASFDFGKMAQGLGAIGAMLGMLSIFSKTMGTVDELVAAGGLLVMAIALTQLAEATNAFAGMSWEELGRGLVGIAGVMLLLAMGMKMMPEGPMLLQSVVGMVAMAFAISILADSLNKVGNLSGEQVANGLIALGGSMLILVIAMKGMQTALPGALALMVVAGALYVLTPVLLALGNMSWEQVITGLVALAGVFVVLGLAGLILTPIVPVILLLGVALGLIGASLLLAGLGVLAFATAIGILAGVTAVGAMAIGQMVLMLAGLIPQIMEQVALGILKFAEVIATGGVQLTAAFTTVILSMLDSINTIAPEIVATLVNLIWLLVDTLVDNVPNLVDAGLKLLTGIINGIADNVGDVVDAVTKFITEFLAALGRNLPKVLDAGADFIIDFLNGLADTIEEKVPEIQEAGWNVAEAIITGMSNGLWNGIGKIGEIAGSVAQGALDAAKGVLGINSPSKAMHEVGAWTTQGFANGMSDYAGVAEKEASSVGSGAINALTKALSGGIDVPDIQLDLSPTIKPVLDLTEVRKNAGQIDGMLAPNGITVDRSYAEAATVAKNVEENREIEAENEANSGGDTFNFTQNNTSPKALSNAEIYRRSKNLLSKAEGALT